MNSNRTKTLSVLLLIFVLALSACTPVAPMPDSPAMDAPVDMPEEAAGEELTTVQVGIVPVTIYAPLFIADGKGYFAEQGIDVEFMPVEGGTENVVQVAAGNFDVAGGGIGSGMFNAVARGIDFEIAVPLHTERPALTSPFVVSKSRFDAGEFTSMADMAGKKVSINAKGAATEYWLYKALEQGNLGFSDVEVLGVGFREVAAALEQGSLDGGILAEPLATFAEDQGLIARLSEDFLEGFTPTVIYFNKEWAAANPELAQGFVTAFLKGARDLNGENWYDEANLALIEGVTNIPADVISRANRSYHDPNGYVPVEDLMALQSFFRAEGQLNYDEDIDISQFINTSYVEQALEDLGGPVEWE